MDGIIDESVVKVNDVEMAEKPTGEDGFFSEGNGADFGVATTANASADGSGAAGAGVAAIVSGGGGGTGGSHAAGEFDDSSDFRFSQGGRGGFR